ncbi:hypothetical protein [Streptomyces justiciae]|uniref:hypothetical protein n=1 Tax=Streptomyces justiciae TaxID=2780140 RepID=UPI0021183DBB|nr:hypothetical protein [Streptomyces justiciae]MCW8383968.1 hypothetical protein [Streptomyces justiciae]
MQDPKHGEPQSEEPTPADAHGNATADAPSEPALDGGSVGQPFASDASLWDAEQKRARLDVDNYDRAARRHNRSPSRQTIEALAQTREQWFWGWLRWSALEPGPQQPSEIGIFPPHPSPRAERLAVRLFHRLSRRRSRSPQMFLGGEPFSGIGRLSVIALTVAGGAALSARLGDYAVTGFCVTAFAAIAIWHAPNQFQRWMRRQTRMIDTSECPPSMTRLAVLHHRLVAYAAQEPRIYELERAAHLGHQLLWDAAGLILQDANNPATAELLGAYEQSYAELLQQAADVRSTTSQLDHAVELPSDSQHHPALATLPIDALSDVTASLRDLAVSQRHVLNRVKDRSAEEGEL